MGHKAMMKSKVLHFVLRKRVVSSLFSFCLYVACLAYVLSLGIHCLGKYNNKIQSVNISYEMASDHPFPDLTFCPTRDNNETSYYPKPYDPLLFEGW